MIKLGRNILMAACALLWLPGALVVQSFMRGHESATDPSALMSLVPIMPAGVPLVVACLVMRANGTRRAHWVSFAVLAPVTIIAGLAGGLLGPIGAFLYSSVVSLPAWAVALMMRLRARR